MLRVRDIINGAFTWMCIAKRIGFQKDCAKIIGKMVQELEKDMRIVVQRGILRKSEEKSTKNLKIEIDIGRGWYCDILIIRHGFTKRFFLEYLVPLVCTTEIRVYDPNLRLLSLEELEKYILFEP